MVSIRVSIRNTVSILGEDQFFCSFKDVHCQEEWQEIWDCCIGNKLDAIYSTIATVTQNKPISHRDAVIINRLQISHSCHKYIRRTPTQYVNLVDFH